MHSRHAPDNTRLHVTAAPVGHHDPTLHHVRRGTPLPYKHEQMQATYYIYTIVSIRQHGILQLLCWGEFEATVIRHRGAPGLSSPAPIQGRGNPR